MSKIQVIFMTAPSMLYTGFRKIDGINSSPHVRNLSSAAATTAVDRTCKKSSARLRTRHRVPIKFWLRRQMKFAGEPWMPMMTGVSSFKCSHNENTVVYNASRLTQIRAASAVAPQETEDKCCVKRFGHIQCATAEGGMGGHAIPTGCGTAVERCAVHV